MATEIATVVDTGGTGDYTSAGMAEVDWFGASGGALVTQNEWCNCRCRTTDGNADDDFNLYIYGWTNSDADHYVKFWTDPADTGGDGLGGSYRHLGKYPTAGQKIYRIPGNGNDPISVVGVWVKIHGIALCVTSMGAASRRCLATTGTMSCELSDNVCTTSVTSSIYGILGISCNQTNGYAKVWNNIIYKCSLTNGSVGLYFLGTGPDSLGYYYDNTVYSCYYGIMKGNTNGTLIIKNNLEFGSTDSYYGTFQSGSTNNAYSEGTDPGVNGTSLIGKVGTDVFKDPANNNFHLCASTPVKGRGTSLSADSYIVVVLDVDREARKTVPDIGADEIAGVTVVVVEAPAARPGTVDRGRPKRQRAVHWAQEQERKKRDISAAFVGMYRRLERGNPD